jgi:hypothetical protein
MFDPQGRGSALHGAVVTLSGRYIASLYLSIGQYETYVRFDSALVNSYLSIDCVRERR